MNKLSVIPLLMVLTSLVCAADQRKIDVSAKATIKVMADIFSISGSVSSLNKESIASADTEAQVIFDGLGKHIEGASLVISGRSASKKTNQNNGKVEFIGYESSILFFVKNDQIIKYRDVFKKLLSSNNVEISRVDYQYSKQIETRAKAREMALLAAKEKAIKMAAVLGTKIGDVLTISEEISNFYGNRFAQNNFNGAANEEINPENIEGEIEISVSVNVSFELH